MYTFAGNKASTACSSDNEHLAISTFLTSWSARSLKVKKKLLIFYRYENNN